MAAPLDGLLLVDKPAGISSHSVVARVRRAVGREIKVGHAGTLDPFATGLMLVLLGRGTRAAQFLSTLDKRYETEAQLGVLSTTGDPEGELTVTGRVPSSPLQLPTGEITQRPPAYSAIKINGVRAYKRARRGEEVEVPLRTVSVHSFTELRRDGDRVTLAVHCGSGTYVRTLVADLGDGYCLSLRRTSVGPWAVADAADLDALTDREAVAARMLSLEAALAHLAPLVLDPEATRDLRQGRKVAVATLGDAPAAGTPLLLSDDDGAVAVVTSDGELLRPIVGFRPN